MMSKMTIRVFVQAHFVVAVHIHVIPGIRLTEDQIEHFEEAFGVTEGKTDIEVKLSQIVIDLRHADFINVTLAKALLQMVLPEAFLFLDGAVCAIRPTFFTILIVDFFNSPSGNLVLALLFQMCGNDRSFTRFDRLLLCP